MNKLSKTEQKAKGLVIHQPLAQTIPMTAEDDQDQKHVAASLNDVVGYRLKRAFMVINEDYKADSKLARLTTRQFTVLSLIADHDEVSQSDIARHLGIERSGMVKLIDQLEAKEYLVRRPNRNDRRVYQLELTEAGAVCLAEHLEAVKAHEERVLSSLSTEERSQLVYLLRRVQRQN